MTLEITIVDREGQQEDAGPFTIEVSDAEADTIRRCAKVPFGQLVDALSAIDDARPDTAVSDLMEAVEAFGDGAELEITE